MDDRAQANAGRYAGLGFLPVNTAMAVWNGPDAAIRSGLLRRAS